MATQLKNCTFNDTVVKKTIGVGGSTNYIFDTNVRIQDGVLVVGGRTTVTPGSLGLDDANGGTFFSVETPGTDPETGCGIPGYIRIGLDNVVKLLSSDGSVSSSGQLTSESVTIGDVARTFLILVPQGSGSGSGSGKSGASAGA